MLQKQIIYLWKQITSIASFLTAAKHKDLLNTFILFRQAFCSSPWEKKGPASGYLTSPQGEAKKKEYGRKMYNIYKLKSCWRERRLKCKNLNRRAHPSLRFAPSFLFHSIFTFWSLRQTHDLFLFVLALVFTAFIRFTASTFRFTFSSFFFLAWVEVGCALSLDWGQAPYLPPPLCSSSSWNSAT